MYSSDVLVCMCDVDQDLSRTREIRFLTPPNRGPAEHRLSLCVEWTPLADAPVPRRLGSAASQRCLRKSCRAANDL